MYDNNLPTIHIESWFIPFDILNLTLLILVIILSVIFLFITAIDKTCHTVPMMLVANSCFAVLICAGDILWISVITLENDVKKNPNPDLLCIFRGYLTYVSCGALNYSFLLQAFYRYVSVVYPARLFWRSQRSQLLFIGLTWIYAFIFPIAFMFTRDIVYNVDNQICQIPLRLSFSVNFSALCIYIIPILITLFIYYKLVRYIHGMNQRITPVNNLVRVRRELKMFRRTVILLMIILTIDFPYALFLFISYFTSPPKYHFRIAYIFVNVGMACVILVLFQLTDPLKTAIIKRLNIRSKTVVPAVA
jgi:hypothetical protein